MTQPPAQQYSAPPTTVGPSGPRANFGQRLVAVLIDVVVILVALIVVVAVLFAIDETIAIVAAYVLAFFGGLLYWAYFEGSPSGQTIGKKAMKIRVIDYRTGGPLGFGRGLIRGVARIPSQFLCYLGYLWMLWDQEKQTWHDKLASTVVVPVSAYPVER